MRKLKEKKGNISAPDESRMGKFITNCSDEK